MTAVAQLRAEIVHASGGQYVNFLEPQEDRNGAGRASATALAV